MKPLCPLCKSPSGKFFKNEINHFHLCPECGAIFRDRRQLMNESEEKNRYLHHISSMEDTGYYNFVRPIIKKVKQELDKGSVGLDYGCGHTPVLSEHLKKNGYEMSVFDPIFHKDPKIFNRLYDFIVCCEVMEHFYHPMEEFQKLSNLLPSSGKLICKTHLFEPELNFDSWYYKNDPSHVMIYQQSTLHWIRKNCRFRHVKIDQRLITFSK